MKSLKIFVACAVLVGLLTVLILPLPTASKMFVLVALAFSAVFVFVDSTGKGKTFAAITIAALVLYLFVTFQRGVLLLQEGSLLAMLLGIGLLVLPLIGAWAMVREIIFGTRVQRMADELMANGELPEDRLPRTASGKIDRAAADQEFAKFSQTVEQDPMNWKHWFNLSTLYGAAGDRKRARQAMRTAIALKSGKTSVNLSI